MKLDRHHAQDRRQPAIVGNEVHSLCRDLRVTDADVRKTAMQAALHKTVLFEIGHVGDVFLWKSFFIDACQAAQLKAIRVGGCHLLEQQFLKIAIDVHDGLHPGYSV